MDEPIGSEDLSDEERARGAQWDWVRVSVDPGECISEKDAIKVTNARFFLQPNDEGLLFVVIRIDKDVVYCPANLFDPFPLLQLMYKQCMTHSEKLMFKQSLEGEPEKGKD